MNSFSKSYLKDLESESIHIFREVAAECKNPVMLYSIGKDSSVMVRLAQKAFYPSKIPFPLMHIDTGFKFPEMYTFRDEFCKNLGLDLIIECNEEWIKREITPSRMGHDKCCAYLKTQGLLQALRKHEFDAAFGGARREEEKSRAKERIFSLRDEFGQWDPKNQRPELWNLYNTKLNPGESLRVFPLSNWTELDIWNYIKLENIPVVPLYFAKERNVIERKGVIIPIYPFGNSDIVSKYKISEEEIKILKCRFRSLGCIPCTGAIRSNAETINEIIEEVAIAKKSERENRVIDLTSDSSMEQKKREGYF